MRFIDENELKKRARRRDRQRRRDILWNILTTLVILSTVCLIGYYLVLFSNPQVAINPFPPPTMPVLAVLPSSTPTINSLPATWTPTPRPTETPRSTSTSRPTETSPAASATPGVAPTLAVTEGGDYPYAIQGEPAAMANTVFHPDAPCGWQGVAGTVVDLQGKPVEGLLVRLTGFYNGRTVEMTTLTGGAAAWYGESGYEFLLGFEPLDSTDLLAVQLVDQALMPISNLVIFDTFSTCDKNLILINFKQVR
jgi:hypothetical protein